MDFNFKTDPIWRNKSVLGLDIGTRYVKVVQLAKHGKLTSLVGYGMAEVPDNLIIEGIVSDPERLTEIIKKLIKEQVWGKITATRVNASLPESKIFTRNLVMPHMNEKELAEAVTWEASQSIPMALTDLYLDWMVIGPNKADPKNDDVIFAAAPKAIVNSYMQLFSLLGLESMGIETSMLAITRAIVPTKEKDDVILAVDLGGQSTNMAIFDHIMRVTGSVLVGGDNITKRIAAKVGVSGSEAEKIKLGKPGKHDAEVLEATDEEFGEITKEMRRIIQYYNEKVDKTREVKKILLCGGNAVIPHLAEYFTEKLILPVEIGNPWANISIYPIKPVPKEQVTAYTNAIGLALVGLEND